MTANTAGIVVIAPRAGNFPQFTEKAGIDQPTAARRPEKKADSLFPVRTYANEAVDTGATTRKSGPKIEIEFPMEMPVMDTIHAAME